MYRKLLLEFDYASRTNGKKPAKEFYDSLPDEERVNIRVLLNKLGEEGKLAKNRFKKLHGCDIWQLSTYDYRLLCFQVGKCYFFTNGFAKQGQTTPQRIIDLAVDIMKEHLRRKSNK